MEKATVELVRYVFLDTVNFTHNRSVEAQADIIKKLNEIVRAETEKVEAEKKIFIPTGDGICICLVGKSDFDSHLRLGLAILASIHAHNKETTDKMRQFQVRVGVNENSDNLLPDINENLNVAGTGINMASRVMGLGDASHLMVSSSTHEVLSTREAYMNSFHKYCAKIKHGYEIDVYQYLSEDAAGLDRSVPQAFRPKIQKEKPLTAFDAYFLGHGLKNELFFRSIESHTRHAAFIMLWFLSKDSVGVLRQSELSPYECDIYGEGSLSIEEVFKYYCSLDFSTSWEFAIRLSKDVEHLESLFNKRAGYMDMFIFPTKKALEKIISDQPKIAEELGLDID